MTQPLDQPKSVCLSPACAVVFDGIADTCPKCGGRPAPQSRIRTAGGVVAVCGVVLIGIMGVVWSMALPLILGGGESADGDRFTGTSGEAFFAVAVITIVSLLGPAIVAAGVMQMRQGRQNWTILKVVFGLAGALFFAAYLIRLGLVR